MFTYAPVLETGALPIGATGLIDLFRFHFCFVPPLVPTLSSWCRKEHEMSDSNVDKLVVVSVIAVVLSLSFLFMSIGYAMIFRGITC